MRAAAASKARGRGTGLDIGRVDGAPCKPRTPYHGAPRLAPSLGADKRFWPTVSWEENLSIWMAGGTLVQVYSLF